MRQVRATEKGQRLRDSYRERQRECEKRYKARNPHKRPLYAVDRRIREKATGDPKIIRQFYLMRDRLCRCTGFAWHVDHIIPLSRGGMHHHCNLQVITASANLRKHNKVSPLQSSKAMPCKGQYRVRCIVLTVFA